MDPDRQRADLGFAQPGLRVQPGQIAVADAGPAGLVIRRRVQFAHRPPERRQRPAAARVIPDARGDQTAGPGDPAHFAQALHRVPHEVHDQLGQRGVEGMIGEWQLLSG